MVLVVVQQVLQSTSVSPSIQSLAGRIMLALFTSLPQIPPNLLSYDLSLHSQLSTKLQKGCITFASGASGNMSKSLGLLLSASTSADSSASSVSHFTLHETAGLKPFQGLWLDIDLMIHPRAPPLVRALPHVESLSLFQAEESNEELDARRQLGVAIISETASSFQSEAVQNIENITSNVTPMPAPTPSVAQSTPGLTSFVQTQPTTHSRIQPTKAAAPIIAAQAEPAKVDVPKPEAPPPAHNEPSVAAASSFAGLATTAPISSPSSSIPGGVPQATRTVDPIPTHKPMVVEDDEDEPMPTIDMGSDSEEE